MMGVSTFGFMSRATRRGWAARQLGSCAVESVPTGHDCFDDFISLAI
jgi:hypothetical protein